MKDRRVGFPTDSFSLAANPNEVWALQESGAKHIWKTLGYCSFWPPKFEPAPIRVGWCPRPLG